MKQKDVALIIAVAVISLGFALVIGIFLIGSPQNKSQKVPVVDAIGTNFPQPDKRYFNNNSVDPAVPIQVDENSNQTPFNTK